MKICCVRTLCLLGMGTGLVGSLSAQSTTWRLNLDLQGAEVRRPAAECVVSGDGRFVAFTSASAELVPGDSNGRVDVFVRDRLTGRTTRASVSSTGRQANQDCTDPGLSADGRYVVFESEANNLVRPDRLPGWDVFVHDRLTGVTTLESVDSAGVQTNADCYLPAISGDGRFVVFQSYATNLVPGDTNNTMDVFLRDRVAGVTTRVSVDSHGVQGDGISWAAALSGDGRVVAFQSRSSNLVPGIPARSIQVYAHDTRTGVTAFVSLDPLGRSANRDSYYPRVSGDGRFVVFESAATNLVAGDSNGQFDVFLRDLTTDTTERVSVGSGGTQANGRSTSGRPSADASVVAFVSTATNLDPADRNLQPDVFLRNRARDVTELGSLGDQGQQGDGASGLDVDLSGGGRVVAFTSQATNLVPGDRNGKSDVFARGPHLTLQGAVSAAGPGLQVHLVTWGGPPLGEAWLLLVQLDDVTVHQRLLRGVFDPRTGAWEVQGAVPPALLGRTITLQAFGDTPAGTRDLTNRERLELR